jgi:hypothetical protein
MGQPGGAQSNGLPDLAERYPELQFYEPPKEAVRVPRLLDGMNCMVGSLLE